MTERELNSVRELHQRLETVEYRLFVMRLTRESMTPKLDGMPHGNSSKSRLEFLTVQIADLEREREKLLERISRAAEALTARIAEFTLTANEQAVTILRYVACMQFQDIKVKIHLSESRLYALHREALRKILSDEIELAASHAV